MIPETIHKHIAGKPYTRNRTGLSGASVAVFEDMVLKQEPFSEESENQLKMLRWLEGKLPAPRVIETEVRDGSRWLLMTRLNGTMSCDKAWRSDPQKLVRVLADAMKLLWTIDLSGCPVDQSAESKLRRAEKLIEEGLVDMENVEPETFGEGGFSSPAALLGWLRENRPEPDRVLTHGDYCLPNIFLKDWAFSGLLDLGRSGAGDRWSDIAILWRSLRDNFGGHYGAAVPGFHPDCLFDALGVEKDEAKLKYYLLMDELF